MRTVRRTFTTLALAWVLMAVDVTILSLTLAARHA
jgi:hypothetical protein